MVLFYRIKVADLESSIRQAVDYLTKRGDLACSEDRYRPSHPVVDGTRGVVQNSASSTLLDAVAEDEDSAMPDSVPSTPNSPIKQRPTSSSKTKMESKAPIHSPLLSLSPPINNQVTAAVATPTKTSKSPGVSSKSANGGPDGVCHASNGVSSAVGVARQFHKYQCWCCRLFTADQKSFMRHVASRSHSQVTKKKIIYCMSCQFRSRNSKRLVAHLKKHDCHNDKSWSPACLLTFGLYTTLTQP